MPDPLCRSPRLVNPRGDIREASACRGDFAPEPASRTRPRRILLSSGQRVGVPPSVLLALKRLLVGAGAPGSGWSRLPGDSLRCVSCYPRDPLPGSASCFNCFSAGELLTFSSEWFLAGVWLAAGEWLFSRRVSFFPEKGRLRAGGLCSAGDAS